MLSVSPTGIDEIAASAANHGRAKANRLLDLVRKIAGPCLLMEPLEYFDALGNYAVRRRHKRPNISTTEIDSRKSVKYFIDKIQLTDVNEFLRAAEEVRSMSRSGNSTLSRIRREIDDHVSRRLSRPKKQPSNESFRDWRNRLPFNRIKNLYDICQAVSGNDRLRRRLWKMRDPNLEMMIDALLHIPWSKLSPRGPTNKIGPNDMKQAAYAPSVHIFVTDDKKFMTVLKNIIPRESRLKTTLANYDEFSQWVRNL